MFFVFDSNTFKLFSVLFLIAIIIWAIYYFIIKPKIGNEKKICFYCNRAIDPSIMFCPYCERLMPIEDIKKLVGRYTYHIKSDLELFDTEPNSSNVISFSIKRKEIVTIIEIGEKLPNDNNSIMLQLKTNDGKKGWCTSKCFFIALFS